MTIEDAVKKFVDIYRKNKKPQDKMEDFYCGITNNLERRKGEHCVDKFLYTVTCKDFDAASELEQKLFEAGFDCGSQTGNGTPDTVYAYIYRKTPDTKE